MQERQNGMGYFGRMERGSTLCRILGTALATVELHLSGMDTAYETEVGEREAEAKTKEGEGVRRQQGKKAGEMIPYVGPQASMPSPSYPAAQAQPMALPPSPAPSSEGSVPGGGNQGQGNQGNGGRGGGRGGGRNGGGRGGQWDNQGYQGQGNQGNQGSQGSGRTRFDWRTAICQHCDKQGHTIRFCNTRREDERVGLIYSNMDGDIYDQFGKYIDRKVPGGVRVEPQRRVAARQAPPATFRLWQEKDDPPIRVEEVESDEEVTKRLRAGDIKEEPIVVESEEESEEEKVEPSSILLGKMEDLWEKMGRYQQKWVDICEEVKGWRAGIPKSRGQKSYRGQEEIPSPSPEAILSPGVRVEMEREQTDWRREATSTIDRYLATHAQEHPDIKEPVPMEPPREPRQPEGEMGAEIPGRANLRMKGRVPTRETAEEKRARVGKRFEEIWQERQRLEAAGALPDQPRPPKPCGIKEMWDEFFGQHGKGLATPERAGVGTSRMANEYLDRRIRFLAKTSFNRYLMLEADLARKKMKEASHGVRLEAVEAEVQELRALVASPAAIIQDLRQQPQSRADRTEGKKSAEVVDGAGSSRRDDQRESAQGTLGQPSVIGTSQEPPQGRVIMGPEEAKAKREAEKEAFEFRTSTELAIQPETSFGPMLKSLAPQVEDRPQTAVSEPAFGSDEGSMGILLYAVDAMQEEASLFSPKRRVEEPQQGEMTVTMEGVFEGRPQRLDTPEYQPEGVGVRVEPSTQEVDVRQLEPIDIAQSYGMSRETSEASSSPGSQKKKKRLRKSYNPTCFFCKNGEHRALQYPKFMKDKAVRKVTERGGKMYDRQGRVVERSADGGRAQLYRQNQQEMNRLRIWDRGAGLPETFSCRLAASRSSKTLTGSLKSLNVLLRSGMDTSYEAEVGEREAEAKTKEGEGVRRQQGKKAGEVSEPGCEVALGACGCGQGSRVWRSHAGGRGERRLLARFRTKTGREA
ncbi:hypothetical protein CBR_g53783 [Chara braunii]|uniref:Uncharacterized protein n=1 Tax=Chara braunii TaxID=69332 RepID=A0A388K6Y6_CHABU|nr:hypothetical protein CBR_g53783 [Chara braunii]|eukprot:GBG65812.1 hypothetical protein CBR_g53783 [Chara braunii]